MSHHSNPAKATTLARVDWLGVVPDEWEVLKFKHLLRERKADKSTDLPAGAISFGEVVEKDMLNEDTLATYQSVLPGEYLINPINLNYDLKSLRVALSNIGVRVSPAYIVLTDLGNANQRYLRWLLYYFDVAHMKTLGAGVRQTITYADIGNCAVALPPQETQEPLASYLDRETARIDALIEKKTRFIELLKEKRQALITQAVTKGLDPNVPMRDSGVEWIGEVPEGWAVVVLKRAVLFQRGHDLPDASRKPGKFPVVSSGGVIASHATCKAKAPGIVTGRYGSIGQFSYIEEDYWPLNTALYSVDLRGNYERFVWYLLQGISPLFVMHSLKSAVPGIDRNDVHREQVAIPQISDQVQIAEFLDRECSKLSSIEDHVQKSIELLKERRSALITAAVTGQIDLREAA